MSRIQNTDFNTRKRAWFLEKVGGWKDGDISARLEAWPRVCEVEDPVRQAAAPAAASLQAGVQEGIESGRRVRVCGKSKDENWDGVLKIKKIAIQEDEKG